MVFVSFVKKKKKMNLLQRSIASQGNQTASKRVSSYSGDGRHTNTHLLFHMNDSHYSNNNEYNQQHVAKKPSTNKSGGFMSSAPEPSPSFDHYNYYNNCDRLIPYSSPSSPNTYAYASRSSFSENVNKHFGRKNVDAKHQTNVDEYLYDKYHYSDLGLFNSSFHNLPSKSYHNKPMNRKQASASLSSAGFYCESPSPFINPFLYSLSPSIQSSNNYNSYNVEIPYRISFIETNIYIPLDLPSSPQHIPYRRNQQIIHSDWIHQTLAQLKHFKTMLNKILVNVEKKAKYPFIIYGSPGPNYTPNIGPIVPTGLSNTLSPELRIFDGLYDICASYTRPEVSFIQNDLSPPLGYIISTFQTFPGEDSEKLEKNWLMWTGKLF